MVRTDIDIEAFKARLFERREEILAALEAADEAAKPVELDQSRIGRLSRLDEISGQQMALAMQRREKAEIGRIDAAMKRIEFGDFGYCVSCDGDIAVARLEANPAVPTCIDCAAKAES